MDVDRIPIKLINGPAPDSFTDPGGIAEGLDDIANGGLSGMYGGNASGSWAQETPMTGSHIPGVDTGARGGQTTFMGGDGRMETVGSNGGSFGGSTPGGSTPYESIMRDQLLSQLPPDTPDNSVLCTTDGSTASIGTATTALSLTGTSLEGDALALGHMPQFGFSLGTSGISTGYFNTLAAYGGEPPPWLANPSLEFNAGTSSTALHDANWVVDLSKYAPWLEGVGNAASIAGLSVEGYEAVQSGEPSKYAHWGLDVGAYLGALRIGLTYSNPIGFTVGTLWSITDAAVSQDSYRGLQGWAAATARYGDSVIRLRKADPGFMIEKW